MKNFITIIILLSFGFNSYSQIINNKRFTSFTNEKEKYIKELNTYMNQSSVENSKIKILMKEFTELWEKDSLPDSKKIDVIKLTNKLLKRKGRQYPQFYDYVTSIITFYRSTQSDKSYSAWNKSIMHMLNTRKISIRATAAILSVTPDMINKSIIYKTKNIVWQVKGSDIYFEYNKKLKVKFDNDFDLVCYAKKDSIKIEATNGIYYPEKNYWKGINGTVTWERAKVEKDKIFANLKRYNINVKKAEYTADSVSFVNSFYFKKPVLGVLNDKVKKIIDPSKCTYPQFKTYLSLFEIKNIYKDVDYSGGFYMKGAKLIGAGIGHNFAHLYFYRKDTLVLETKGKLIIFNKSSIIANNIEVTLRLDTDSIYHPGLLFKYNNKNRTVQLIRNGEGSTRIKYYDSYHNVEIDVKVLEWQMDMPKITFRGITQSDTKVTFESKNFFSIDKFMQLQGDAFNNPLYDVKAFEKERMSDEFTDLELADYMRMSEPAIHRFLLGLSYDGFISYDFKRGNVKIKDKLNDYIKASAGKKDYDVMRFVSETRTGSNAGTGAKQLKENAYLSLLNNNIIIAGVKTIHLSDSQNVTIFPAHGEIVLKKNRDFDFSGKVLAGMFLYKGTNFSFDYNKFMITMPDIAEMKMQVASKQLNEYGTPQMVTVSNTIQNMTGDLLIDSPTNKSGLKDFPRYPIFYSKKESYVYYDKKRIQKGVYNRDKFYFQVFPYEMDSLNSIDRNKIGFDGHFVSAGIFPPFDEKLKVMRDNSLGFTRKTPPSGYDVYGGKANYKNLIDLSDEGLRGAGDLEYVTSLTKSDEFFFYPDSLNTRCKTFDNTEKTAPKEFPQVHGVMADIHFMPYQDELYTSKYKTAIKMFNEQAVTHGTTVLSPDGMKGFGRMNFVDAEMKSKEYIYGQNTFTSDTANFKLLSQTEEVNKEDDVDFATTNVNALIDFNRRLGEFVSNDGNSTIEFPKNQYICYMDKFTWYMDKDEIMLSTSKNDVAKADVDTTGMTAMELEDVELTGSQFISLHPRQDSLNFWAPTATYSRRKSVITANEVRFIRVADATIYPSDGKVVVQKKAVMDPLKDSKIRANNITRFHHMYNCETNIYGKKDYMATGDYDFIDENKEKQKIHFDIIAVDSTVQTYATGKIGITENFTLSPKFAYTGKVKMEANKEFLIFDGYFKINHTCESLKRDWVGFKSEINQNDIFIPISNNLSEINGGAVRSSFLITNDTTHIYAGFLTKPDFYTDNDMIPVEGYLHYNKDNGKYEIAAKDKLEEFNLPGPYFSIHPSICNAYSEGIINLAVDFGQIKYFSAGNISGDLTKDEYSLDLMFGIDFMFLDKCMEIMANDLIGSSDDVVDLDRSVYTKAITDIVGKEKAEKYFTELSMGKFKKYPEELIHNLVFNDLHLDFDKKERIFVSNGDIGVGTINKIQVNRLVKGKIEITKRRSGDKLVIYLEVDGAWYYFSYMRSVFRIASSNKEFNALIMAVKPDDRRIKPKKGQKGYSYYPATVRAVKKFKKKYFEDEGEDGESDENIDSEKTEEKVVKEKETKEETEEEGFGGEEE